MTDDRCSLTPNCAPSCLRTLCSLQPLGAGPIPAQPEPPIGETGTAVATVSAMGTETREKRSATAGQRCTAPSDDLPSFLLTFTTSSMKVCMAGCLACYPARPGLLYSGPESRIYKPLAWSRAALYVGDAEAEDLPVTNISSNLLLYLFKQRTISRTGSRQLTASWELKVMPPQRKQGEEPP